MVKLTRRTRLLDVECFGTVPPISGEKQPLACALSAAIHTGVLEGVFLMHRLINMFEKNAIFWGFVGALVGGFSGSALDWYAYGAKAQTDMQLELRSQSLSSQVEIQVLPTKEAWMTTALRDVEYASSLDKATIVELSKLPNRQICTGQNTEFCRQRTILITNARRKLHGLQPLTEVEAKEYLWPLLGHSSPDVIQARCGRGGGESQVGTINPLGVTYIDNAEGDDPGWHLIIREQGKAEDSLLALDGCAFERLQRK